MTKKEILLLIATAKSLIGKLNKFQDFLTSVDESNLTDSVYSEIEFRLNHIGDVDKQYDDICIQLVAAEVDHEEIMSADDFSEKLISVNVKSNSILRTKLKRTNSRESLCGGIANSNHNVNARLPKLAVPTFSGEYTNFTSYHEAFTALIQNNNSLTDVERFMYLRDSLKGPAAQLISNIQPTGENYKIAFDLLCERFNNPKLIVSNHVKGIFELKPITKDNAVEMRDLHDNLNKHLRALDNMSITLDYKAIFVSHILMSKFDPSTCKEYSKFKPREIPSLDEINKFLKERCQSLEEIEANKSANSSLVNQPKSDVSKNNFSKNNFSRNANYFKQKPSVKQSLLLTSNKQQFCPNCKAKHSLNYCPKFLALTVQQRIDLTRELKICKNCLYHSNQNNCNSRYACQVCARKHHTLLHLDQFKNDHVQAGNSQNNLQIPETKIESETNVQRTLSCFHSSAPQVILPTAIVQVRGKDKRWHKARILLDSGSHINLITEAMADKLQLNREAVNTKILGINSNSSTSNSTVKFQIASLCNNYRTYLSCVTIERIAANLPLSSFNKGTLVLPNVRLADSNFNVSGSIDILIGASLFYSLLCTGQIPLGKNMPILQKTVLGWVVSGSYAFTKNLAYPNIACSNLILQNNSIELNQDLEMSVHKFWEMENVQPKCELSKLSHEEQFCERHFEKTVTRDASGRFIVSIPFNSQLIELGESKDRALDRFIHLEQRLLKNPELYSAYTKFMREYIELGHMKRLENANSSQSHKINEVETLNSVVSLTNIPNYYLPHHAVIKNNSLTTKLRVVFDGSAKSNSNISINDTQITGPVIQNDIFSILLRFRQHIVAFTGDIEKMYRQILISEPLRKFQQILWRDDPKQPVHTYQLQTITYGTTSASYLATRCLKYLADLNSVEFPVVSKIIKDCFFMDDLLAGADTIEEALYIKLKITDILASANLPIRKFLSNKSEILTDVSNTSSSYFTVPLGDRENAKALGISWNSLSDVIQYNISIKSNVTRITKRTILSEVAQLYDPLGLLSPLIVKGKLIIQKLWQLRLAWDESIPQELHTEWINFKTYVSDLHLLKIPRCVKLPNAVNIQIHGFSDSSSVAYGACIYVRCQDAFNNISVHLLCSKSRVSPIQGATIPRLELSAAVLLTQLIQKVKESLAIKVDQIFLWTDSTIVLHWINSAPNRFKTFVANRIASIQELTSKNQWQHISTHYNPADLVSRGATISDLVNNKIWFCGPMFLSTPQEQWPKQTVQKCNLPATEFKKNLDTAMTFVNIDFLNIFSINSKLIRLKRVIAWIIRFSKNSRVAKTLRIAGPLKGCELQEALVILLKLCQAEAFPREIRMLKANQDLKTNSNILSLNPFLDADGILRVGGRIKNSCYSFDKKFPALLPKDHIFTNLVFEYFHEKLLHCGAQQLLACIREQFWPISGRNLAKHVVHNCIKCFKTKPRSYNPLMGDLPQKRLQSNTPVFSNVGIDYAGPILIKDRKTRGAKLIKAYICIFVCLVTKAIHLELVTDLTTDAFIAVLKRFISRRGKPATISSDNAKYFIGAANQIRDLYKFLKSNETQNKIIDFLSDQNVRWDFIIPLAPHQGGMWEGGVKSTKLHLKKVLGNTSLNYEDFQTLLTQIEATLNSRPLSPISTDPEDLNPLTPGHFIIGRPLCALPEPSYVDVPENHCSRYQHIQRLIQMFWKRWSKEVIPELQKRTKWFRHLPNLLHIDSVVLLQDDNLPPLQWCLGRVTEIHHSSDNIPRSATVITSSGKLLKRTVHKLCVLPGV